MSNLRFLDVAARRLFSNHQERLDSIEENTADLKTVAALRLLEGACPEKGAKVTVEHHRGKAPKWVGLPAVNNIPSLTMTVKEADATKIVIENASATPGAPFGILLAWDE